jgi:hypothetical protein
MTGTNNITLIQFEKGEFKFKEWEDHLENGIGKAYAMKGYTKRVLFRKIEKAISASKSQFTGEQEEYKLNADQKEGIWEMIEAVKPTPQVMLFNMLMSNPEGKRYHFLIDADKNHIVFYETGRREKNTVEVVSLANYNDLLRHITASLHMINPHKTDTKIARALCDYLQYNKSLYTQRNVDIVAEPNDTLTFTTTLIPEIIPSNTLDSIPSWAEFLQRCSDPEAFGAWIWSIYEPKHKGRQMLYLYGKQGEDGKSVLQSVVYEMFGAEYSASVSSLSAVSTQSTFGASGIYGRRLLIIPDLRNNNLLRFPIINQLTGSDPIKIEFKNQTPFSAKLNVRIFICANIEQELENKKHDSSRLLWLTVSPPKQRTPNWCEGLKKEYLAFLQYAKWCYQKKCADHYKISSEASDSTVERIIKTDTTGWYDVLSQWFDIDPSRQDWSISKTDLFGLIPEKYTNHPKTQKEIRNFLIGFGIEDLMKPKGVQINGQRGMIRGIRGAQPEVVVEIPEKSDDRFDFDNIGE